MTMKKIALFGTIILLAACAAEQAEENKEVSEHPKAAVSDAVLVELDQLSFQAFEHHFNVDGVVEAKSEALVAAEGQGRIKEILVAEGQWVSKGTVLARLNNSIPESQYQQAESQYTLAKITFDKVERLWKENQIGSEMQYLEAEARLLAAESQMKGAKAALDMTIITAPIAGIVDQINMKLGSMAGPQQPFAHIVNLNQMVVIADVSERYSKSMKQGDAVLVEFPDLGIQSKSKISRVGNVINPQNRSFEIEIPVKSKNGAIKPNALAKLQVRDFYTEKALVIPSNAIQRDPEGDFVFLAEKSKEGLKAVKRYVTVERTNDDNQSMVVDGVKEGEWVVVNGYNLLTKGSLIKEVKK